MGLLETLKGYFSRKQTLADLDIDDLRAARAKLEREQDRVLRQIAEIEKEKAVLDAQGRAERQARQQKILAQRILQLEGQAKHHDRNLAFFSKQLRIIDGFVFLKENQRVLSSTPLGDILQGMDTASLRDYVDQATIDGSLHMDKLNELLGVFEEDADLSKPMEEDAQVADIVARWQRDQESEAAYPDFEADWPDLEEAEGDL